MIRWPGQAPAANRGHGGLWLVCRAGAMGPVVGGEQPEWVRSAGHGHWDHPGITHLEGARKDQVCDANYTPPMESG